MDKIIKLINDEFLGEIKIEENLSNHCSIRAGGKVKLLFYPDSVEGLAVVLKECKERKIPYKIIGRGSNIIFPDHDINILIIKINGTFGYLEFIEENKVLVGAGFHLQKFAKQMSKKGLAGLEFAGGIPATVGGATYMNAGAHTQEISDIIEEVIFLDNEMNVRSLKKEDCKFSYRDSIFKHNEWIVLEVLFKFKQKDKAETFKRMSGNLAYRKEMQPLESPSFGSVFKNPPGAHAGKIIEELGLKGKKIGGAMVSFKHANFIINEGDATTSDIMNLIKYIQKKVKEEKNINLVTEVEIFIDNNEGN